MNINHLLFILEMIGNAAFAVSGVMVARDRHMDLFGAVLLGCTTACGGGVIRDILLGQFPPAMFTNPVYVASAALISVLVFIFLRLQTERIAEAKEKDPAGNVPSTGSVTDGILNTADAIGLAAFVVVGCQVSADAGYASNGFLCVFVGVVTGIGGGILRDILAGQMPLIMRKRIYGVAAIAGAVIYWLCLYLQIGITTASSISIACTILLRFLAIHYRWNLPKL